MWCIIVWNVWWKLSSSFAKQIPRNRLQQFVFRLHLQNPRWDWARIASASVTFYSTTSLSIKTRCSLSTDPPIITQKPGVPATPQFTPRDAECPFRSNVVPYEVPYWSKEKRTQRETKRARERPSVTDSAWDRPKMRERETKNARECDRERLRKSDSAGERPKMRARETVCDSAQERPSVSERERHCARENARQKV